MHIKDNMLRALLGAALAAVAPAYATDAMSLDDGTVAADAQWRVWGGQVGFRWNEELLRDLGLVREEHGALAASKRIDGLPQYALRDAPALQFGVNNGAFTGFSGGALSLRGGVDLVAKNGRASLRDMRLVARPGNPLVLDVHGSDGVAWLFVDRMMYEMEGDASSQVLSFKTMDLRIAPALAELLGNPRLAGISLADMAMDTHVYGGKPILAPAKRGSSSKWPGLPVPGVDGAIYEADVFMHDFDVVIKRSRGTDGPGGSNGSVVYAPSSTLRNNRNDLTLPNPAQRVRPTVPSMSARAEGGAMPASDPMGTSTVMYAADVPWNAKFSGNHAPYGNDQHPFLIWNLFRIDASGRIDQIGRSGVKHAWLTTNSPCDVSSPGGDILGRGCADTYSDGNNDALNDLGPRSELVPADGLWGRCGSVYDRNCDGVRDAHNPALPCQDGTCGPYAYRMEVKEADIDPTANPGASYVFESWYIVRDDVNIFNTMQSRPVSFVWESGIWNVENGQNANLRLGPALDRWVDHAAPAADTSSSDIDDAGGHARVAAKVSSLGPGAYRYDYAVMNLDFARAETSGAEPNLRVLSNDGFTAFSLPIDAALPIDGYEFSDGDGNPANDWPATREGNRVVWRAPAGNALNWGTMYRFGLLTAAPPVQAVAVLTTADTDLVEELQTAALVPQSDAVQTFAVGGTLAGLAADGEIALRLNNGAPLVLDADGAFDFPNEVLDGGAYTVSVVSAPVTQSCEVAGGTGTIAGADVVDVTVTCADLPPPSYTIGGTASGLANGRSVTLELNGDEQLVQTGNGSFAFGTLLVEGDAYAVTIASQPADRNCTLQNATGTATANVTNVVVTCSPFATYALGGSITGLAGNGAVELRLNGAEVQRYSANGAFTLQTRLAAGRAYAVTVTSQPPGRVCTVANGSGTMPAADVTDIAVACAVQATYSVGGTIAGLPQGSSIALQLNGGTPMPLTLNGAFNFPGELPAGASYAVTVATQPSGRHCSVVQGSGSVGSEDVHSVQVVCAVRGMMVFESGFE